MSGCCLVPIAVVQRLWLWQPLTYAFVETSPLGVIFGALILWQLGGPRWSRPGAARRMALFAVGTTVTAGVLHRGAGSLVPPPAAGARYAGGTVMASVALGGLRPELGPPPDELLGPRHLGERLRPDRGGLRLPQRRVRRLLASWCPPPLGLLLTWAIPQDWRAGGLAAPTPGWRLQRQLRSRAKHLKLVSPERNTPGDSIATSTE